MKYFKLIPLLTLLVIICCCRDVPPIVKLFKEHLNKKVVLAGFDNVYCQDKTYTYNQFRKQFPFVIVNYIDEECTTCKVKLREWYENCDKLPKHDNLAYVFVFRGKDYKKFMKHTLGEISDYPFFILASNEFTYVANNSLIDRQIIDGGYLLDKNDRIKAIGSPLLSQSMLELIEKMVNDKPIKMNSKTDMNK